jgi:hypothetical protein
VRLFVLVFLVLAGCATVKDDPSAPVQIVWQKVDDVHATCEEVSGRREIFRIMGCSKWRDVGGQRTCTIYAQTPRNETDVQRFATLGHELMHCTDGNWHDRWGRMNDEKVRQARRSSEGSAAAGGSKPE